MGTGFLQKLIQKLKDNTSQPAAPTPALATRPAAPKPARKTEKHNLTGIKYYMDAVMALAKPNPDYNKSKTALQREGLIETTVTEYIWPLYEAELEPEPDNPHDPNAIKVLVDGRLIGYIKAGSCARVHKKIREDRIERMTVQIGGGRGKILVPDEDSEKERYVLEDRNTVYWANLIIHLKPEK